MTDALAVREPAYLYALASLRGLGPRGAFEVARAFPDPDALTEASPPDLVRVLSPRVLSAFSSGTLKRPDWARAWESGLSLMEAHLEHGIVPLAITDARYPPLLRAIPDPPTILYVRGAVGALSGADAIAVVGTREPTENGLRVTRRVACHFAGQGLTIVSGLAKGIDTAAHEGALQGDGRTVAVLATPFNKIYPAENRPLADEIVTRGGALVTEVPLGQASFKGNFVQRDRIQSGLSVAVVPVQTDVVGGTMHTVRFAQEQDRLIYCPRPVASEAGEKQWAGIIHLIQSGVARDFQADDYDRVLESIRVHRAELLNGRHQHSGPAPRTLKDATGQPVVQGSFTTSIGSARREDEDLAEDLLRAIERTGLDQDLVQLERVLALVKSRLRGTRTPSPGRPSWTAVP